MRPGPEENVLSQYCIIFECQKKQSNTKANTKKPNQNKPTKPKHQTVVEYSIKKKNLFVCFLLISLRTEVAIKYHYLAVPTEKIRDVVKVKRSLNT